ncbi:SDR family NAD(P)-dependent oxidoreductase, partial [Streptomyces sp. 8N706]|uniref:SDR family NAD(P)-dependent oxidoreductase n=1 Tax=Streptomyces sp. 8N706 TaxID=3457416 RepID=UPI003FCF5B5A
LDLPLREMMWDQGGTALDRTEYTQPALFAVEVALHGLLDSWGVRPAVLAGHSIGEIAAAYAAGVLSLRDAATLVSARGRLMQELPTGAMVAVRAPEAEVTPLLRPGTWIAAVNAPSSVVVSGDPDVVTAVAADLAEQGLRTRRLRVDRAFHSGHVDAMLPKFAEALAPLTFARPRLPLVSSVTGRIDEAYDAAYWLRQVREPVRFADALATAADLGPHHHLEVGPSSVLTPLVGADGVAMPALRSDRAEDTALLTAVAALSCAGVPVDWTALVPPAGGVDLPTYAFQHQRYWLTEEAHRPTGFGRSDHPVLTSEFTLAGGGETVLTGSLSTDLLPQVADHVVLGEVVVPGGVLADMAVHAAAAVGGAGVSELVVESPLVLAADGETEVQVRVHLADESGDRALSLYRRQAGGDLDWVRFAAGEVATAPPAPDPAPNAWPPAGAEPIDVCPPEGARLGAAYSGVTAAWERGDEIFVELDPAAGTWDAAWYAVPGLAGPLVTAFRGLWARGGPATRARIVRHDAGRVTFEATDATGRPVVSIASVEFAAASRDQLAAGRSVTEDALFRMAWQPLPLPATPARCTVVGTPGFDLPDADRVAALVDVVEPVPDAVVVAAPRGDATDTVSVTAETLRTWLAEKRFEGSRLVLLTRHGAVVGPGDEADPAQAALWGLVRSAQSEHPDRFALVDIDGPESGDAVAGAVATGEPQLALRLGGAFAPSLVRADAPAPEPLDLSGPGTVLITGGTGGLGALLARHLVVHRGARRLLLVSRRGIAAPGADALAAELTALGAEIDIRACDIGDREALTHLLASIPAEHPLTAVIHAAGVTDDCAFLSLDRGRIEPVLAAKAQAAHHLVELTADAGLQALVLFSSASGVLGGPGQGNYAAANAFLDALAHRVRQSGGHAISLAWGLWSEPDGLGGRLSPTDLARMAAAGMLPLDADEGLELFDRTAAGQDPFLIPARLDIAGLRTSASVPHLLRTLVGTRAVPASAPFPLAERLAELDDAARERAVEDLVGRHVARVLGHAAGTAVDPDRGLLDLGLDSLTAVELRNHLERETGLRLSATVAFDYPTSRALADHLTDRLAPAPAPRPVASLESALGGLEAALGDADPAHHSEVTDRLTDLLRQWTNRSTPDHTGATPPDLTDASLTEVLDFIDAEFKLS